MVLFRLLPPFPTADCVLLSSILPLKSCVGGFKCATCGCDLASSQLHFMGTFNAFFFLILSLSLCSLEASKPLHLSIEPHQQNSSWYLSLFFFFLRTPLPLLHGQYPLSLIYIDARTTFFLCVFFLFRRTNSAQMKTGRKKPKLLVRFSMKGHGTRLINSYDAAVRWLCKNSCPFTQYTVECALVNI